ncbi:MAG: DUF3179 domain-containing (seleno)protein [bacterium]
MRIKLFFTFTILGLQSGLVFNQLNAQVTLNCNIQEGFIVRGCFGGRDCIPALTNPALLTASEATSYLGESDLVLGVFQNGVARAYPHRILWWHEIVNDTLGGEMLTISFCPLTSTGLLFDATLNGEEHTFGVSGLLYNDNLIMYDRLSGETLFPQLCFIGRDGNLNGQQLELLPIIETTWSAWKALYPNTTVLSDDTGFDRNYSHYPYGDYRTNNDNLLFPLTKEDHRLERKDIIFGIILNNIERAYPFKDMGEMAVLNDDIGGPKVLILFIEEAKLAISYYREVEGQVLNFELQKILPSGLITIRDKETGTIWNTKGEAMSGPLALNGTKLVHIPAYNAMWFAWGAFWENPEIADIASLITSVEGEREDELVPQDFALYQNFPNPFNPTTNITYDLDKNSLVTLKIYDVLGQVVRTLVDNENQSTGRKSVLWDGRDDAGELVASGIYVYRIRAGEFSQSRKMIMLQ